MTYRPLFHVTPHLLKTVEEISAYREKIVSASVQVRWIPALQKETRARNSHSSTAIEGNPLTLEQVRVLEEGRTTVVAGDRAKREVLNYLTGLRFVEKNQAKKTISHRDLFQLHRIIASKVMDQGEAGHYRKIQVRVGSYQPPPAGEVPRFMNELLKWWDQKATEWSPVISSAIVHYRFEEIHPFADGNGRVGRALALWELYRRGFDSHHIFSVDEVYWEDRPRYYQALDAVRKSGGDLTGWLEYTAEALHLTLERVWLRVQQLSAGKVKEKIVLTPKQEQLLHLLRDQKSLAPSQLWKGLGVTKQGAMKILNPLLASGLIRRIGTRKSGKYILGN
ncbi:MAG: Fic family protein [Deltaproteobacteria bacterium]|nr:Fic family protein [Deltaproteobacteria bacterium]